MENTNKNKLFNLINERFKKFELNNDKNFSEIGYVVTVNDGVIYASGLQNVEINELVKFQNGVQGVVLSLEPEFVGIVALGDYHNILENTIVKRLKKIISIPFSENYIGKIIDPFGKILDSGALSTKNTSKQKFLPIESSIGNFLARRKINESLQTGILLIDAIFPIGKGQRQLIVGDRQTGKTTIAIDTIINQKEKNVFCIYVSIGQKNSTLASIYETLKKHGALKHTIIISSPASDYPGMKYVAPFSGMSIAEEWMKKGRDVLIIFDDLYKHAIAYRNISLILKRPPGRESYPGDIFYLHSRLLERAGKYIIDEKKNICGSITAFPIMETQYGDISSYISTNLISITDGQIFTNSELFNNNQKPAIDIGLSVSRIGSAAQEKIIKKLSSSLKIDLSNYLELLIFNKFNVDMDKESVAIINRGKKIMNIMTQNKNSPYTFFEQVIILLIIFGNIIEKINPDTITDFIHLLLKELGKNNKCKKINNWKDLSDNEMEMLLKLINTFIHENKQYLE